MLDLREILEAWTDVPMANGRPDDSGQIRIAIEGSRQQAPPNVIINSILLLYRQRSFWRGLQNTHSPGFRTIAAAEFGYSCSLRKRVRRAAGENGSKMTE